MTVSGISAKNISVSPSRIFKISAIDDEYRRDQIWKIHCAICKDAGSVKENGEVIPTAALTIEQAERAKSKWGDYSKFKDTACGYEDHNYYKGRCRDIVVVEKWATYLYDEKKVRL